MKILKAGEYYIGDCCYVLDDDLLEGFDWSDDFCEQFWVSEEDIIIKGENIVAYSTAHGDGVYPSSVGFNFPVDAGLIGCTPKGLWKGEGEPFGCFLVKFDQDFKCSSDGSTLSFGHVEIYTDWEDEDDE